MLFDEARASQPSIIFFDEIDGKSFNLFKRTSEIKGGRREEG